ncbi:MAG: hypothetical protein KDK10_18995 [Maritimibacter sp.]|nr:hypothetical protein [Maritimibacter sp.]
MTALTQYQRLEAPGVWRAGADAQRRNVIVALGDATLTLTDSNDRALAHWSLATVRRKNPGEAPALYAPSSDPAEPEALEIDEPEMIDAIETVRRAIDRSRPKVGRLRHMGTLALVVFAAALAIFWAPGALTRQTATVLPAITRDEIGARLLARLDRITGSPCATKAGSVALDKLRLRLLDPERPGQLVVFPAGVTRAQHLPGGTILIGRDLLEDFDAPEVTAGYILAEATRAEAADPMLALLTHAGPFATARLLATGTLTDRVLDSYAEVVLTAPPVPLASEPLLAHFTAARVASTPYAFAVDPSGETTLALIEADPAARATPEPVLDPADWADLRAICEGG